jgi:hypothetical protein
MASQSSQSASASSRRTRSCITSLRVAKSLRSRSLQTRTRPIPTTLRASLPKLEAWQGDAAQFRHGPRAR